MKHFSPSLTVCGILFNLLALSPNALPAHTAVDSLKADSSKKVTLPLLSGNSGWTGRRIIENQNKLVAATPEQLMAGQMAGVRVIETNGTPGGVFSVQVRGVAALASSNEPLYIIDGFPVDAFNADYALNQIKSDYPASAPNVLSIINPSDIESMEIVKNGSALAMYGSRAAHGAVIIRTKRGRTNGLHIDFESTASIQRKRHAPDILNTTDFIAYQKRIEALYPKRGNVFSQLENPQSVNWIDEATQTGTAFRQQLGISGGFDFLKFSVQGNLSKQKGFVKNTGYDRKGVRVNLDFSFFNNRLRFGTSTYYAAANIEMRNIQAVYGAAPIGPAYNADGFPANIKLGSFTQLNPLAGVNRSAVDPDIRQLFTTQYAEIGIVRGLTLRGQYGVSGSWQDYDMENPNAPYGTHAFVDHTQKALDASLNYRYALKNYVWEISAGYAEQKFDKTVAEAHGKDQGFVDRWLELARDHQITDGPGWESPFAYGYFRRRSDSKSLFAQTSLSTGRWNFHVNARRDSWVKNFGSIGASVGWQVPDRGGRLAKIGINSLRLVADYGRVAPIYDVWTDSRGATKIARNMMSLGSELGLFDGKLHVELDVFNHQTNYQLYVRRVPLPGNNEPMEYLAGAKGLYSRGFEISATGEVLRRDGLVWKVSGNFTAMANRIREPLDFFGIVRDVDNANQPIGSWFAPKLLGVWNTPQEIMDAGYSESDVSRLLGAARESPDSDDWAKQVGSAFPNMFWGLSSTLEWRRFDATLLIRGEHGQKINNGADRNVHGGFQTNTTYYAMENAWAPDRPDNNMPTQLYNSAGNLLWYLQKAGFVRLQNVAIGYTFPVLREKNARVFISGQNLLLLTKYKGWDPEVSYYGQSIQQRGQDYGAYPRGTTLSLGIQLHL